MTEDDHAGNPVGGDGDLARFDQFARTFIGFLVSWVLAIAVWAGYIEIMSSENWNFFDLLGVSLWLGAPLVVVVPLVVAPLLKQLNRRVGTGRARYFASATIGAALSAPVAYWLVLLSGGTIRDLLSDGSPYIVLYAAFGFFFGAWYSWSRTTRRRVV